MGMLTVGQGRAKRPFSAELSETRTLKKGRFLLLLPVMRGMPTVTWLWGMLMPEVLWVTPRVEDTVKNGAVLTGLTGMRAGAAGQP